MFRVLAAVDGSRSSDRAVTYLINEVKHGGPAEVHLLHVRREFDRRKLSAVSRLLYELQADESDSVSSPRAVCSTQPPFPA